MPAPPRVTVAPLDMLKATLPVPGVASPIFKAFTLAAKPMVPPDATVKDLHTAVTVPGTVTTAPDGMVTLSAAVGWTPPAQAAFVFQLLVPVFADIAAIFYALAMQRHLLDSVFHTKPTSRRVVDTVVVGNATVLDSNDDPQVMATALVPVIETRNKSPSTGEPLSPDVNEVIAVVWLVMCTTS